MIRINILPKGLQPSTRSRLLRLPWRKIGVVALGIGGVASAGLWVSNLFLGQALERLTKEWEGLRKERSRLEEVQAALRGLQNRAAAIKVLKSPESQWAPRLNLLSDALVSQLWFTSLKLEIPKLEEESISPKRKGSASKKSSRPGKKGSAGKKSSTKKKAPAVPPPPPPEPPHLLLRGSYLVVAQEEGAPVRRYLQRLKEQPRFEEGYRAVELKSVEHRQVQQEEVSDFVIALTPTGM